MIGQRVRVEEWGPIGKRIRKKRLARGLTQGELAQRAKISTSMLSACERGARPVSIGVAARIANALGISVKDLIASNPQDVSKTRERLIAAAPELYKACKAMHQVFESIPSHDYTMEQLDALAEAWWVICKVEGRPEDG